MLDSYIKFVKAHETILALVLGAALVWGVSGKIENIIQRHDASHEVQVQIVATAQAQKDNAAALKDDTNAQKTRDDVARMSDDQLDAALRGVQHPGTGK